MSVVGIIAEYNPFHNGHLRQLSEVRRRLSPDGIVAVMSGSFVQRGSVAVQDKWQRAKAAVLGGASLVLELPAAFAVRSAEHFAAGGIRLLDGLGVVDTVVFGAERDDLSLLRRLAGAGASPDASARLRAGLERGESYAAALAKTLAAESSTFALEAEIPPDAGTLAECLRQPNVILAVEYLRAIEKTGSPMVPVVLPRFGAMHGEAELPKEADDSIASASSIRAALAEQEESTALPEGVARTVPSFVRAMLADALFHGLPRTEKLFRPLLGLLHTSSVEELQNFYGVREGLEHRLRRAALSARSYDSFIEAVGTKRYPRASLRRMSLHLLLGFRKEIVRRMDDAGPLYARVLAFDDDGRRLLRSIRRKGRLPVVTRTARFLPARTLVSPGCLSPAQEMLALDFRSTALASLCTDAFDAPRPNDDLLRPPVYVQQPDRTNLPVPE